MQISHGFFDFPLNVEVMFILYGIPFKYAVVLCLKNTKVKVKVLVAQSCPTLCDLMDCSLPGSSVYGILQARIPQWVAMPFSRGSSQPRD